MQFRFCVVTLLTFAALTCVAVQFAPAVSAVLNFYRSRLFAE